MLNQIVNRLQGQVRIRVETAFPERVLNLCGARNLAFWDMEWESADRLHLPADPAGLLRPAPGGETAGLHG